MGAEAGDRCTFEKACSFNIIHCVDEYFEFEIYVLFALYAFVLCFSI
jgi:hypothetical protein